MKRTLLYFLLQFFTFQTSAQVWRPLGEGLNAAALALSVDSQSNLLYVGGDFTRAGGLLVHNLAIWDGIEWHVAPEMPDQVNDLLYYKGQIYAALDNGWVILVQDSNFEILGAFNNIVKCLKVYKDTLYAGGYFTTSYGLSGNDDTQVNHIAKYANNEKWLPVGKGISERADPNVKALHDYNGDLIAGGRFEKAGDSTAKNIARWNGYAWYPMEKGVVIPGDEFAAYVIALDTFENELIVGGEFKKAGNLKCHSLATWSDNRWDTLTIHQQNLSELFLVHLVNCTSQVL
ncbi:MAG: hypothetical protein H0W62_12330 [Chitinophagales bacterium]|nr:hypothetical protein [Chitinophagales bacterium]